MTSIIVPAHNEERAIARNLRAMFRGTPPGDIEVIVVCNGCSDRTADIARGLGLPVRVLELDVASKAAALNAGDAAASGYPRIYVDADVRLDGRSVARLAAVLKSGEFLFANPSLRMELDKVSWAVRAFYLVWTALPYNNTGGMVGTGVYALSEQGRRRFTRFPDIIGDDAYVRHLFSPRERTRVHDATAVVEPPRDLRSLIKIKTRSRVGGYQLRQLRTGRKTLDSKSVSGLLGFVLRNPRLWLCWPVYVAVNLIVRIRARLQVGRSTALSWERDESSRAESNPEVRADV